MNDINVVMMKITSIRNLVSKSLLFADTHNSHAMNMWVMSNDEYFIFYFIFLVLTDYNILIICMLTVHCSPYKDRQPKHNKTNIFVCFRGVWFQLLAYFFWGKYWPVVTVYCFWIDICWHVTKNVYSRSFSRHNTESFSYERNQQASDMSQNFKCITFFFFFFFTKYWTFKVMTCYFYFSLMFNKYQSICLLLLFWKHTANWITKKQQKS